jgi:hypothetical protein
METLIKWEIYEHNYRIFNQTAGCVVVGIDATFDGSDDSQKE